MSEKYKISEHQRKIFACIDTYNDTKQKLEDKRKDKY